MWKSEVSRASSIRGKKLRKPVTNVRHEGKENKMTKVGKSGIHYSDDKVIGRGLTSIVYEGYFETPIKKAAVKRVFSQYAKFSEEELDVWLKAAADSVTKDNVNIVQLYRWTKFQEAKETNYYFAMEMATSDLERILQNMVMEEDKEWRRKCLGYLKDAAHGLEWLHSKRVIHRDIKPENILIFSQNSEGGGREIAKLADFGISKKISDLSKTGTESMGKGTLNWMAPEAINAKMKLQPLYSKKVLDISSFGMTGHYTMTKGLQHPFEESKLYGRMITMNILKPDVEPSKLEKGEYLADHLFQWMMSHVPNGRPNIRQVVRHPLFWSIRKQLKFIVDVAKSLDKPRDPDVQLVKSNLDEEYKKVHPHFDWQTRINFDSEINVSSLFFQRQPEPGPSKKRGNVKQHYDFTSVTSLIKLIRDKNVHHGDIVDDLICEKYFGRWNEEEKQCFYCEEKYGQYFISKFPDLLIFLFVFLIRDSNARKLRSIYSVQWNYDFKEYNEKIPDIPNYSNS